MFGSLWLGLVACAVTEEAPPREVDPTVVTSTPPPDATDTGAVTSSLPTDTSSGTDTAPPLPDLPKATVGATVLTGPRRHCVSPQDRAERPFDTRDLQVFYTDGDGYAGSALVVADLFGDGRPALFFGGDRFTLYRAATRGWDEVSEAVLPLLDMRHIVTGSAADYDGDGDFDLFLGGNGENYLLENREGVFHDISDEVWESRAWWTTVSSSWADLDGDGDLDLMVGNYAGDGVRTVVDVHPSELYLNEGGQFIDVSDRLPSETQDSFVFMTALLDVGGDHLPELFSIHGFSGSGPSRLLHNVEGESWALDDASGFHPNFDGMGIAFADLNDDGAPDIAQTSHNSISLRLSSPSADALSGWAWEIEHAGAYGVTIDVADRGQSVGWGLEFGDLDNDTDQDLVGTFGFWETFPKEGLNYDALWLQGADGQFEDVAEGWGVDDPGVGRGLALADLNRDGWLDIIKRDIRGSVARVHHARCGEAGWVGIRPTQPETLNHHAIGATVDVWTRATRQRRWIMAGSTSMFSSTVPEAHFGLGDHLGVDAVVVTWPDGEVSVVEGLEGHRWHRILRAP